jgi:hypothetical protein
MVERIALLLSYLIKKIRITTNTIATTTPLIPPAIGSMLLVSDIGPIAGGIGAVVVVMVLVVILVIFIR